MPNDYFNHDTPFVDHTLVRAQDANAVFNTIASGLDYLPGKDELQEGRHVYVADTGAADAYVVTLTVAPLSYEDGLSFNMKAANANAGASTINVNGLGVKQVRNMAGAVLAANDILAGAFYILIYDATNGYFRIMTSTGSATGATEASVASAIADHAAASDPHAGYVQEAAASTSGFGFVIDEDSFASDLATKVPTQQSVKAYVTASVAAIPGIADGDFVSNGLMTRTAEGVYTSRTVAAGSAAVTITNGSGEAGNPTVDLSAGSIASLALADSAVQPSDTDASALGWVVDEDDMVSNSATKVPTQQSVKAYVEARVVGMLDYQGGYDASTNTPDLDTSPSGSILQGYVYTVTAAGTFFTAVVSVGDMLIAEQDAPTTEAHWTIVESNLTAAIVLAFLSGQDLSVDSIGIGGAPNASYGLLSYTLPLAVIRTANDTSETNTYTMARGSGAGNLGHLFTVGGGANDVAAVGVKIGSTTGLTITATETTAPAFVQGTSTVLDESDKTTSASDTTAGRVARADHAVMKGAANTFTAKQVINDASTAAAFSSDTFWSGLFSGVQIGNTETTVGAPSGISFRQTGVGNAVAGIAAVFPSGNESQMVFCVNKDTFSIPEVMRVKSTGVEVTGAISATDKVIIGTSATWLGGASYEQGGLQIGNATYAKLVLQTGGAIKAQLLYDSANTYLLGEGNINITPAGGTVAVTGATSSTRFNNGSFLGSGEANAKNHFVQSNAGTATLALGWIAAAYGDTSTDRVIIGQGESKAIIGAHTGNLDGWGPLTIAASTINFAPGSSLTPVATISNTGAITATTGVTVATGQDVLGNFLEGTWTPVISGSSVAGVGTYVTEQGFYTRIGRIVYFELGITTSAHTGSGEARITLPFTANATQFHCGGGFLVNITFPAGGNGVTCQAAVGSSYFTMYMNKDADGAQAITDLVGTYFISGFYRI